jgi:prephenate dehydratase
MPRSIAYLGPSGTYAEQAANIYARWLKVQTQQEAVLCAYPTIAQSIKAVAEKTVDLAIAPVENSIEGSVSITLDMLWHTEGLQVQSALELPIHHMLVSNASQLGDIQVVYSHPQPLGQCQQWLSQYVPQAQLIPTSSTTDALQYINQKSVCAAIASEPAATLYDLPILVRNIQDFAENCTRFWVIAHSEREPHLPRWLKSGSQYTSIVFSLRQNLPGALVSALQLFADRSINLSRIESRPTKRTLGEYIFYVDAESNLADVSLQETLHHLEHLTETLKVIGTYSLIQEDPKSAAV